MHASCSDGCPVAYLGFDKGGPHPGVWGTEVLSGVWGPPAVFCDFEANLEYIEAPFNGQENTKLISNNEYTDSGVFRIW